MNGWSIHIRLTPQDEALLMWMRVIYTFACICTGKNIVLLTFLHCQHAFWEGYKHSFITFFWNFSFLYKNLDINIYSEEKGYKIIYQTIFYESIRMYIKPPSPNVNNWAVINPLVFIPYNWDDWLSRITTSISAMALWHHLLSQINNRRLSVNNVTVYEYNYTKIEIRNGHLIIYFPYVLINVWIMCWDILIQNCSRRINYIFMF